MKNLILALTLSFAATTTFAGTPNLQLFNAQLSKANIGNCLETHDAIVSLNLSLGTLMAVINSMNAEAQERLAASTDDAAKALIAQEIEKNKADLKKAILETATSNAAFQTKCVAMDRSDCAKRYDSEMTSQIITGKDQLTDLIIFAAMSKQQGNKNDEDEANVQIKKITDGVNLKAADYRAACFK